MLVAVMILLILVVIVWLLRRPPSPELLLRTANKLSNEGNLPEALAVLEPLLDEEPTDGDVAFLAGDVSTRMKQFAESAEFYSRVPQRHSRRGEACFRAGDILLLRQFQLSAAEVFLREAVELNPGHQYALAHLAGLSGLCGFTSETATLRFNRLQAGQFSEVDLVLLALGDTAAENAESLKDYLTHSPDDPLTILAQAHQAWQQHDFPMARMLYERGLKLRPDSADAQARLGRILSELPDTSEFLKWRSQLNVTVADHAEIWAVFGDWSLRQQDSRGAIRCFWEAARRDPAHRRAHHQLGQLLASIGETRLAEGFQKRNETLQEFLLSAKQFNLEPTAAKVLQTITAADRCGHAWEVWGWAELLRVRFPQQAAAVKKIGKPAADSPRVLLNAQPALQPGISGFELPAWMTNGISDDQMLSAVPTETASSEGRIHFVDDAERTGLKFEYSHGDDIPGPGMRMFQFSGGGTGVLDYDRDGWPDVYLTQGGLWPVAESPMPSDVLFRNLRGSSFENVSRPAAIFEPGYSQGLAIADVDADGWPDIFVANVDGNRLFRNNGDGTFDDITSSANIVDEKWSTSAVCADFNGDGWPDLYVVNYLQGPDLLTRICHQADGTLRACTPHEFDAADDQLLMNLGNGQFKDVTSESGMLASGGKGLGVVAADFDGSGRLSVFVGNDTTANFFLHNQTATIGEVPHFEESAVISGLAFDREGRAQACMGIAAGDADGDGQLDLFVSNYFNESNTLYQRQANLLYFDTTANAGLREPGIRQLGFGAQFLDADLDGWSDLVVSNGHVDDETAREIPLHMPTQFFRNIGEGQFEEVPASQLGKWFEGRYLGRSVARVDWNRDGREDILISNLDSPAALLTNESSGFGRFIAIQLVGTVNSRDAFGTVVEVKTNSRTISRQLIAGDGYQASNERQLIFAVGDQSDVEISIRWPSGHVDNYSNIQANRLWCIVEGRTHCFPMIP